jgi:4-coumarate--CoA ligase
MGWDPRDWSSTASVGELNPNCEAKIMAEDGITELGYNQCGELWVRGQNVMKGYWNNPKATSDIKTSDGWLKTGDIAYIDNNHRFYIIDRKKVLPPLPSCFDIAQINLPRLNGYRS